MTRDQILTAAFDEAVQAGFYAMTRDNIAERAGVATGSVNHHFKDMANLRHAVMHKAIQCEQLCIIATGLAKVTKSPAAHRKGSSVAHWRHWFSRTLPHHRGMTDATITARTRGVGFVSPIYGVQAGAECYKTGKNR